MDEATSREPLTGRLVRGPAGLRRRLERAGATFPRIGQQLALFPDLVPPPYRDELLSLLDRVAPSPWPQVRGVLEEDLGRGPEALFDHLNPSPFISGALAQTHSARLRDGTPAAVKIERSGGRRSARRDLRKARLAAGVLERSGSSPVASPADLIEELSDRLLRETDLQRELASLERLFERSTRSRTERVPRPFPDLSGSRVLTCERLHGVSVGELIGLADSGKDARERLTKLGIDGERFAGNLIASSLQQIFRWRYFNADLHPANLLILEGDAVGFVGFGFCEAIERTVREQQLRFLSAVWESDVEAMVRSLTEILVPAEGTDLAPFHEDFTAFAKERIAHGLDEADPPESGQSLTVDLILMAMRCARRNDLGIPRQVRAIYRTLTTAETVARRLGSRSSLQSVGRDFFSSLELEDSWRQLEPERLLRAYLGATTLAQEAPGRLRHLLEDLSQGRFVLRVQVSEKGVTRRERRQHARLLSASILTVGLAVLLTWPDLPGAVGWPLTAILTVLYVWIFFQWRRR